MAYPWFLITNGYIIGLAATAVSRHPLVQETQVGEDDILHPVCLPGVLAPFLFPLQCCFEWPSKTTKIQEVHKKLDEVSLKVLRSPENISILPEVDLPIEKTALMITPKSALPDYTGPRSTVLFNILDIPHTFLDDPEWRQRPEYMQVKMALKNLTPVNVFCERVLALATHFNGLIIKD